MQSVQPKNGYGMTAAACLWLGLFPLLQGGTYAHLTHDKWIIMLVLTGITLLCFLFDLFSPVISRQSRIGSHLLPPVSSFLPFCITSALTLWTALSCFFSDAGVRTWWLGESARMEGLATQLCYFVIFALFFFSRVSLKPVLLSASAGLAVFSVIVLLQRGGGNPLGLYPSGRSFEQNPEFQGTIGNIDMGTGYLLLLAGLFLYGILKNVRGLRRNMPLPDPSSRVKPGNLPAAAVTVACSFGLLLSLFLIITMEVQFGLVSLAVLFLVTAFRYVPAKRRLTLLILLLVLVLILVWFWPGQSGGIWELHEILHGRARLSFGSNRIAVWLYSLRLAKEDLLLGGGSGTFVSRFNQYLFDHGLAIPSEQDGRSLPSYFDNPHNEYIAQLTDHGLPSLLLFTALLLLAVFRRRHGFFPLLSPCSAAVLCYAVQAFFSFSVCIVAPMFWMLLAISFREYE